jgi:hypothetical protein
LVHNSITTYFDLRDHKYTLYTLPGYTYTILLNLSYFPIWLSGFIESEGCFSIRKNGNHSFSIGQNDEVP